MAFLCALRPALLRSQEGTPGAWRIGPVLETFMTSFAPAVRAVRRYMPLRDLVIGD